MQLQEVNSPKLSSPKAKTQKVKSKSATGLK